MEAVLQSLLAGLPLLLLHLAATLVVLVAGVAVYMWITPYEDLRLVREGNVAAAVALGGVIVGMAIPLAFTLAGSINVFDILFWGVAVVIVQIATFKIVDLVLRGLPTRIENGEVGAAIVLTAAKLAAAALNAAAVAI